MGKFRGIQALRAFAACMVVTCHTAGLWSIDFAANSGWKNGMAGVDIFFVISGFVMAISKPTNAIEFTKRRIIRVFPLYWIMTAGMFLKSFKHYYPPHGLINPQIQITTSYVFASVLLIPYRNSVGIIQPLLPVGWTLCFEMFFYLLIAAALAMKVSVFKFLTVALIFCSILGMSIAGHSPATYLLNPILLEFLGGLFLGNLVLKGYKTPPLVSGFLGIAGIVGIFCINVPNFPGARSLTWGVCAFLIVHAAVMLEDRLIVPKWVLAIGAASYSLYLSHVFVIQGIARLELHERKMPSPAIMVTFSVLMSVIASLLIYRFIENPINSRARDWGQNKSKKVVANLAG